MVLLRLAAALMVAAVLSPDRPLARPLTPADLLQMEHLGRVKVTADRKSLLLERRRPYHQGARFDYDDYSDLFRTTLQVVDLRRPGPPAPLFAHEAGLGYALGPASPDGARAVVYRLKAARWELGVADVGARTVQWTGLTPEISEIGRAVAWLDARRLALIELSDGLQPFQLRMSQLAPALAGRWDAQGRGARSMTVVGSGRFSTLNPRDPASRLVILDARTGDRRAVAHGAFKDMEVSPDGAWVALAEDGEDIPLRTSQPIRGDYGAAKRRRRLVLVELASGRRLRPCETCDISRFLISWSPKGGRVLVFARDDGATWKQGRLLEVSVAGTVRDLSSGRVALDAGGVSELIAAGWLGEDAVAFGRAWGRPSGRKDWWRLGAHAAQPITTTLVDPPAFGVAADQGRLLVRRTDGLEVLSAEGERVAALKGDFDLGPAPVEGPLPRYGLTFLGSEGLTALRTAAGRSALVEIGGDGLRRTTPAPSDAALIIGDGEGGALLRRSPRGGEDIYLWLDRRGRRWPLFTLNTHLADLDGADIRSVRHLGPDGQPLISWLLLPKAQSGAPPPLVVWPYLGRSYAEPPSFVSPRRLPTLAATQLLVGRGYAVLLPSLPVARTAKAPSDGVAKAVLGIIEAAATQPSTRGRFDSRRLGLWGHSFGGYSVAAIVSQTDRFAAGVTWAAAGPNLFGKWGDFGLPRRMWPQDGLSNPSWTEDLQGDTRGPPWETPQRFFDGSPVLHLGKSRTPLLVSHGDLDGFPIAGSEQIFSAYQRRNSDAVMATYWGEGHILRNPAHLTDFYTRGLQWLDVHLRGTSSPSLAVQPSLRALSAPNGAPNPRSPRPRPGERLGPARAAPAA